MSKRSDVELELINEFKNFDLTRQHSQDSVPPSRFKIKAAKQESTPSPPTRPTRISLENDRKRVQSLPRQVPVHQISPPPRKPPPPVPRHRMPDLVQGASKHTETLDDQGYLMPEELGIPQHVQRVLNQRGPKLSSTMTMPHLRNTRQASGGSLPNDRYPFRLVDHCRKDSTGNLSVESFQQNSGTPKVEKKVSLRPLPATPPMSIKENLAKYPWFQDISREEAENSVSLGGKNGTYLVRRSKNGGPQAPFTLTLYFQGSTYNLNIRHLPNDKFILGKKKSNEMVFGSLKELVERHKKLHLKLIDKHGNMKGQVVLTDYPKMSNC